MPMRVVFMTPTRRDATRPVPTTPSLPAWSVLAALAPPAVVALPPSPGPCADPLLRRLM